MLLLLMAGVAPSVMQLSVRQSARDMLHNTSPMTLGIRSTANSYHAGHSTTTTHMLTETSHHNEPQPRFPGGKKHNETRRAA